MGNEMDDQRPLPYDDTARGFVGVPHAKTETSKITAKAMLPKVAHQRRRVFEYIHAQGARGATPHEVSDALELPTNSAGPRVCELREMGKIIKVNERRPTSAGGTSRVHVAVEEAEDEDFVGYVGGDGDYDGVDLRSPDAVPERHGDQDDSA